MRLGDMESWFYRIACAPLLLAALGGVVAGCATLSQPLDPMELVSAEVARGEKTILVPKAVYEIDTDKRVYFDLSGLDGVTIDFQGSRLNGGRRTRMFNLSDSTNVVLRNVTIDYRRLPFTEAVIEKVDAEKNWDVRIVEGYPLPDDAELSRMFWPIQVYDAETQELKNPMRSLDGIKILRTGECTYRITGGRNRIGDIGDYCVWSVKDDRGQRDALNLARCSGCRIENVTVYSTPMGCGFNEVDCTATAYSRCRLVRCPEGDDTCKRAFRRLRSGNHDAFNARRDYVGPAIENCRFEYHCDDNVNISGFYAVVTRTEGDRLRILPYCGKLCIDVGDSCQIFRADGKTSADVRVVGIAEGGETTDDERRLIGEWKFTHGIGDGLKRAWWLKLDGQADMPPGSCIISNRRMGNGFRIVNSHFGSTRGRGLMIKASEGLVASNVIEKTVCTAIVIKPEFQWMEGGCSRNVDLIDNEVRSCGGECYIGGMSFDGKELGPGSHPGVVFRRSEDVGERDVRQ